MDLIEIHNMENSFYICDTIIMSKDERYDFESIVFDNKYIYGTNNKLELIIPSDSHKICINPYKIRSISNTTDNYYDYSIKLKIENYSIFDEVHYNVIGNEYKMNYNCDNLYLYMDLNNDLTIDLSNVTKKINITGYSKNKITFENHNNKTLNLTNFYCNSNKIFTNLSIFYKVILNNTTRIQYKYDSNNLFYKPIDNQLFSLPINLIMTYAGLNQYIEIHEFSNKFINLYGCNYNNCLKFKNCIINIYNLKGHNSYVLGKSIDYENILNGNDATPINSIICQLENSIVNIYFDKIDIIFVKDDKSIINDYVK